MPHAVTRAPTVVWDSPSVAWITVPSWIDVSGPIVIAPSSPRSTAAGQIDERGPTATSPMSTAVACTNAVGSTCGRFSPSFSSMS